MPLRALATSARLRPGKPVKWTALSFRALGESLSACSQVECSQGQQRGRQA